MSAHPARCSVVFLFVLSAAAAPNTAVLSGCWSPPVVAPITDPFREPACRWCPGNRGIEYGTEAGTRVRAVASGRVTYADRVAGTGYVVVRHADGHRATYGGLATWRVDRDDVVVRGAVVGTSAGRVHFGLRDGDRYVDPAPWLGRLVRRPWLLPVTGDRPAPPPPAILRCRR